MPRNVRAPLFAAIACAVAIPVLAVAAYANGPVKHADLRVLLHLERESGTGHALANLLVNLGDLPALLILLGAVCWLGLRLGRRREVIVAVIVVAGANLTTQLLKTLLEHVRYTANEHGYELPWPNSFPSGHTTAAASIAVALLLVVPAMFRLRAAVAGLLLTAAVALSVVVLSWHFPSDVLGALLVVGAWGFAALTYLRYRDDLRREPSTQERRRPRGLAVSTE
jgi:membrane-associated phospholipid phosphatase